MTDRQMNTFFFLFCFEKKQVIGADHGEYFNNDKFLNHVEDVMADMAAKGDYIVHILEIDNAPLHLKLPEVSIDIIWCLLAFLKIINVCPPLK